jgi:protein-S-isoprenylcysteine O-methyltransferase Ste14
MALLIKNLLFTLVAPGTIAVYLPLWIARGHPRASGGTLASAWLLLGLGSCIYAWCVWDFAVFGRGTPAPLDAPKKLVVRGLYRLTRNPMYVGVLTVILGWAACFEAAILLVYASAVFTGFQLFIVLYEEPHLLREFGREYETYRDHVGRWLLRPRHGRLA